MTSKAIQHPEVSATNSDKPAPSAAAILADLFRNMAAPFAGSGIEQAQARYRAQRQRAEKARAHANIVESLPLEEKQRLGLYRLID